MAKQTIKQRVKSTKDMNAQDDLLALFNATQDDLTALRAAFVALTAKLDLDAGVTDTNYASLTNPAVLQLTK